MTGCATGTEGLGVGTLAAARKACEPCADSILMAVGDMLDRLETGTTERYTFDMDMRACELEEACRATCLQPQIDAWMSRVPLVVVDAPPFPPPSEERSNAQGALLDLSHLASCAARTAQSQRIVVI